MTGLALVFEGPPHVLAHGERLSPQQCEQVPLTPQPYQRLCLYLFGNIHLN